MAFGRLGSIGAGFGRLGAGRHVGAAAAAGGAALLVGETDGFATDFTYATDASRVAVEVSSALTSYGLDSFYLNGIASPKRVFNAAGTLIWSPHNLCLQSQTFDQTTPWTASSLTVTANAVVAPDGTTTADLIVETATLSLHAIQHAGTQIATIVGETYTWSIDVKPAGRSWIGMAQLGSVATDWFDVTNGVVGTTANNGIITSLGGGWYRCAIAFVASGTSTPPLLHLRQSNGQTGSYTGDGVSGVYLHRGQVHRGSVPLAYLPTTTAIRIGLAVDYHPSTHAALGLLVEKAATNLLLNSTTLSTQNVTVSAVAYTLSIYGTGTVTLSGVSTAGPLVGTGVANRVSLTFTPTAGSLTLTISGTVSYAQLETGAVASSIIPTYGATVTRVADSNNFLLSTIPAWSTEFSIYCRFSAFIPTTGHWAVCLTNGPGSDYVGFQANTSTLRLTGVDAGGTPCNITGPALAAETFYSGAARIRLNDSAMSVDGAAVGTDVAVTVPTPLAYCCFGSDSSTAVSPSSFRIQKLVIVPRGWSNTELVTKAAA
jgi:hypothetical protein